jgi:hypothetical protein
MKMIKKKLFSELHQCFKKLNNIQLDEGVEQVNLCSIQPDL